MKVAIFGERSGKVRDSFRRRGHEATSYDLHPSEAEGPHVQGDYMTADLIGVDLLIMHPTCTYLCSSGLHWNRRVPGRQALTDAAIEHVRALMALGEKVGRYCLENPVGCIGTRIRPADQTIQPWQFGDDASKATCLWLHRLPLLAVGASLWAESLVLPGGREARRANQTANGQNKLGPSPERAYLRAQTYQGLANAMADQWGDL